VGSSDPLIAQLDGHVEVARRVGSPFYSALLERMRDDVRVGGPTRAALRGRERDRVDEWDAFRLLAGVHRIVLTGCDLNPIDATTRRRQAHTTSDFKRPLPRSDAQLLDVAAVHRIEEPRHQIQPAALSLLVMTEDVLRHDHPAGSSSERNNRRV
jgi:hypothetical protein